VSRASAARPSGPAGRHPRTCCCAGPICRATWRAGSTTRSARALYLFQGNKDTLFRIHGTNEPDTIGHAVSSGCIRMNNADVMDLYQRVQKGAKVVVI
jgi:lipoprotein-anchoring transpeptidase ErfK/SrfK